MMMRKKPKRMKEKENKEEKQTKLDKQNNNTNEMKWNDVKFKWLKKSNDNKKWSVFTAITYT